MRLRLEGWELADLKWEAERCRIALECLQDYLEEEERKSLVRLRSLSSPEEAWTLRCELRVRSDFVAAMKGHIARRILAEQQGKE